MNEYTYPQKVFEIPEDHCGRWYFTNANVRVSECDCVNGLHTRRCSSVRALLGSAPLLSVGATSLKFNAVCTFSSDGSVNAHRCR